MTRDVLVSITGARFSEQDKEDVEMIIGGEYFWKNGKHYVLYEEVMEESGEVVKNTVKITPDSMDILKKGSINTHMVFQKGKKNVSCYLTPVGELMVEIETKDIEITETEDSLKVDVEYALEINYDHIADCSIVLCAKSRAKAAEELEQAVAEDELEEAVETAKEIAEAIEASAE